MVVKYLYTLFVGLLLATFVGVGISTFYERPKPPEPTFEKFPVEMSRSERPTPSDIEKQRQYERNFQSFQEQNEAYNRNVAIIALAAAILLLISSMTVLSRAAVLNDGFLLGGLLTLIYGIGRSFDAGNQKFLFLAVSVGLATVLIIGYLKFIKPHQGPGTKKSGRI